LAQSASPPLIEAEVVARVEWLKELVLAVFSLPPGPSEEMRRSCQGAQASAVSSLRAVGAGKATTDINMILTLLQSKFS
jgi:hypothetical protein